MIDTHCHLTEERLLNKIDEILLSANEARVEKIIVPATSLEDAEKVIELTKKYENVYGLVGVHPESISGNRDQGTEIRAIREILLNNTKILGIGEVGLDFYWDKERKFEREQIELFKMQMEMAVELDKPVVIHNREADKEIMEVLRGMKKRPKGQFHCWAGSEEMLNEVLDMGFYISFCGNITYKSAQNLREALKMVPVDRLLLETDSPYLSPEGKRGTTNTPANVKITAGYIANLINTTPEELDRITTKNSLCLYWDI